MMFIASNWTNTKDKFYIQYCIEITEHKFMLVYTPRQTEFQCVYAADVQYFLHLMHVYCEMSFLSHTSQLPSQLSTPRFEGL